MQVDDRFFKVVDGSRQVVYPHLHTKHNHDEQLVHLQVDSHNLKYSLHLPWVGPESRT